MNDTKESLIAKALAGGITQEQIDLLLETFPVMREEAWWLSNGRDPVRAIRHRLEIAERDAFKRRAAAWTDTELRAVAAEHRRGRPVDSDKLAEACARGFVSVSAAMNSDF